MSKQSAWGEAMDQIQAMRIFIRIAELESFSRAAEDLNLPRATVSTTLKALEQKLGVRLFLRTTRQVKITAEGELYYQRCLQLLAALDEADNLFASQKTALRQRTYRHAAFAGQGNCYPPAGRVPCPLSPDHPKTERQRQCDRFTRSGRGLRAAGMDLRG